MPRRPRIPGYRRHSSGQARVTLNGKDYLLGPYGSAESKEAYRGLIAEWIERPTQPQQEADDPEPLSVNDVILAYWQYAAAYYGFDRGHRRDAYCLKDALCVIRSLYGRTPAHDFGPLALKACRAEMIKKDWSRTYVNAQVDRIRRAFRWAASEQLVPVTLYQGLRTVESLRRGRTEARETAKVKPVASERVEATIPHMPPVVRTMVNFQLLTGCRPEEVCRLRPLDLDMTNPACWVHRPGSDRGQYGEHKTAHHDHEHLVFIGPRAQETLCPHLGTKLDAYCFSPVESEQHRSLRRREARQTRLTPSQQARRPKTTRRRPPQDRYQITSYWNAIYRACDRAFPLPEQLAPRQSEKGKMESRAAWWARLTEQERDEVRAWRRGHRWHPNQLRHTRATELRRYGLDVAKTILGHSKVETTQIYAEKDVAAAMELVAKIG
jgi:integrase